ncbi:hypothetical protein BOTBODRAFT_403128 [Botryobasidium botryosum FD-172 SS1]|uniref:F-box domain-containing protein n=1 Tax=Botryobasidium botryosum (strain FD-172 SS1) TaxID=930990 RepID=A0A067MBC3_BOTB1|nr:hypothetical protein BOTBODRAFT_403128 [Botryobasidium botryosum FD-172 SS1]
MRLIDPDLPEFERDPVSYFNGYTPRLRDLLLTRIYISLDTPIYLGLQKLHLSFIIFTDTPTVSLIRNLITCPLLEELTLREVYFPFIDTLSPVVAFLPCLRIMNISLVNLHTRYLLASIQAPAELMLSVGLNCRGLAPSIVTDVDTSALERLPSLARIHSIDIKHNDDAKRCVVVGTSDPHSKFEVLKLDYFLGTPALTDCPPSFAYALRVDADSHIVCPLLRWLWLESDPPPDSQRLFEVLESRASSNWSVVLDASASLFHLTLRGSNFFDWKLVPKLLQLSVIVDWAKSERKVGSK